MTNLRGSLIVGVVCLIVAVGCKKKDSEPAAGSGSGSAAMGSGSGSAAMGSDSGSAAMGSGSAMAGSGSAVEAAGSGSAGSGSAMAGSGSGSGSGSAMMGSAAAAPKADAEGHRKWDCKKTCKLALKCKAAPGFKNEKECDQDCTSLAKDKDGRYARGSVVSAAYYTCTAKAKDCAGIKKCDHDVEHAK